MAGWPSLGRVEDHRLAQALRAGDTTALAEIYDGYAPRLFDYCHALLRDQDLAADALHDSLIAAQQHIGKLREPERFRGWLYAIVRNECLRLLNDPDRPMARHEAPEEADDAFMDATERQRREETRQLVHSALAGLSGRQREAVDLAIRHDLSAEELAGVLGMSAQQATELVTTARDGLDDALTASIIARTARNECPSVAALVDEQDWPLHPEVCRKLVRHIASCPTCRERRRRKVSTNRLMQVLPVAALPSDLRMAVLSLADAPDQHETRTRIAQRAEPFDVWGWPTSLDRVRAVRAEGRSGTPRFWPAVAAAACVILVVGAIFLLTGGGSGSKPAANSTSPGAAPSVDPSDSPSPSESPDSPEPTPTHHKKHSPSPTPTTTRPAPMPTRTKQKPKPNPTLTVTSVDNGNGTATATLRAKNGTVHWTAHPGPLADASPMSGTLQPGQLVTVTIQAKLPEACAADPQVEQESVMFTPGGGSATVTWKCT